MTAPQAITSEIQKLEPSAIVELFELDATAIGGSVLRFHAGTNGLLSNVVWQGNTYSAFPLQATGFDFTGNGQLPRPKLVMANATGTLTALVLLYEDLLGAKVTRRRTLVKYLDAVNFPARRNLLLQTDVSTSFFNTTIVADSIVAPDGNTTADTVTATASGSIAYSGKTYSGFTSGQTYTFSRYVKKGGFRYVLFSTNSSAIFNGTAVFDFDTGTLVSGSGTIQSVGNGWFRCSVTGSCTTTGSQVLYALARSGPTTNAVATSPGQVMLYEWGAQLETGSSLTEYQPVGATWSQNPTADPTAEFPTDIFYIDRKASETRDIVEFELASSFDVAGVQLPRRQIVQNVCTWRYRGTECGYSGTNYFDANDAPVGSLGLDVCGKRLSSCKKRFGADNPLPFGSFPAAGLTR